MWDSASKHIKSSLAPVRGPAALLLTWILDNLPLAVLGADIILLGLEARVCTKSLPKLCPVPQL